MMQRPSSGRWMPRSRCQVESRGTPLAACRRGYFPPLRRGLVVLIALLLLVSVGERSLLRVAAMDSAPPVAEVQSSVITAARVMKIADIDISTKAANDDIFQPSTTTSSPPIPGEDDQGFVHDNNWGGKNSNTTTWRPAPPHWTTPKPEDVTIIPEGSNSDSGTPAPSSTTGGKLWYLWLIIVPCVIIVLAVGLVLYCSRRDRREEEKELDQALGGDSSSPSSTPLQDGSDPTNREEATAARPSLKSVVGNVCSTSPMKTSTTSALVVKGETQRRASRPGREGLRITIAGNQSLRSHGSPCTPEAVGFVAYESITTTAGTPRAMFPTSTTNPPRSTTATDFNTINVNNNNTTTTTNNNSNSNNNNTKNAALSSGKRQLAAGVNDTYCGYSPHSSVYNGEDWDMKCSGNFQAATASELSTPKVLQVAGALLRENSNSNNNKGQRPSNIPLTATLPQSSAPNFTTTTTTSCSSLRTPILVEYLQCCEALMGRRVLLNENGEEEESSRAPSNSTPGSRPPPQYTHVRFESIVDTHTDGSPTSPSPAPGGSDNHLYSPRSPSRQGEVAAPRCLHPSESALEQQEPPSRTAVEDVAASAANFPEGVAVVSADSVLVRVEGSTRGEEEEQQRRQKSPLTKEDEV